MCCKLRSKVVVLNSLRLLIKRPLDLLQRLRRPTKAPTAMVDALGNPLKFILSPGQQHDSKAASALIEGIEGSDVLADKAYDDDKFIDSIENKGCRAVIPPRKNRKNPRDYDKDVYKERHLIECFFGKIKYFRRIFSRFDKTARAYMGFLNIVTIDIWLR